MEMEIWIGIGTTKSQMRTCCQGPKQDASIPIMGRCVGSLAVVPNSRVGVGLHGGLEVEGRGLGLVWSGAGRRVGVEGGWRWMEECRCHGLWPWQRPQTPTHLLKVGLNVHAHRTACIMYIKHNV